jgi:hypothetical protein
MYVCMYVCMLLKVKHVFAESRGRSSDGEDVWKKYSAMATKSRKGGAIVAAVVVAVLFISCPVDYNFLLSLLLL